MMAAMTDIADPHLPVRAVDTAGNLATSTTVQSVFDHVLDAIHSGRLQPGEHLNDGALAEKLGVSRTPVREALLRLRELGVVEASANRFTRVALVDPTQTFQALIVWTALYDALIDEVVLAVPDEIYEAMCADHDAFNTAVAALRLQDVAIANFAFFARLMTLSENAALLRGITSVVHIIRLGSFHLPDYVDFVALAGAQKALLAAIKSRDLSLAHDALMKVRGIPVPT